jgi:histidinol-phosphate aminotransferase
MIKNKFSKFKQIDQIKRLRGTFATRYESTRLDANERISPFNNKFIKNIKKKINSNHFTAYPEIEEIYDLLSKKFNLERLNFLITAGSDAAIRHCFELFTEPKSKIITLNPTFGMYDVYAKSFRTKQIKVNYNSNLELDINFLIKSIDKDISMIMMANPNSPTGTIIEEKFIKEILIKAQKNNCYVVIDEAYFGFYKKNYVNLINKFRNLIIIRTFSKAAGMAGLRAGYIISNQINIKRMYAFRPMYEINSISCLVIKEIFKNSIIITKYIKETELGKKYLINELNKLGYSYYDGFANFILVNMKSSGKINKLKDILLKSNILYRTAPNIKACKNHLRFTLGPIKYMKLLVRVLKKM